MEHGPVPPHERSWRHPSELAADETAELRAIEVPRSTRTFALATGSLGLVALGVFVLVMTPSRDGAPIAVSATTAAAVTSADAETAAPTVAAIRRPVADVTGAALATPIGDGDYAVAVRSSVERSVDDLVQVVLPSGRTVAGSIVVENADTVLVHLTVNEPGHRIAERRPRDRDMVTVLASPPVDVAFSDVDDLDVADGTAVVDAEGGLVGLCRRSDDGTKVLMVDDDLASMDDPGALDGPDDADEPGATTGTDAATGVADREPADGTDADAPGVDADPDEDEGVDGVGGVDDTAADGTLGE